jgi:excisionase family DNA binding protein
MAYTVGEKSELTTEEAARLLGVSLPTLIHLLNTGVLPYRPTHGGHGERRIPRRAALDHLRADLALRNRVLDALAVDAEDFGFFDD